MKKILKITKSSAFLVFADQAIFSGTNFFLTFFLARQISIIDFGIFSSILLITYLLLSISNALLIQPFQIFISKQDSKEELGCVFFGLVANIMFCLFIIKLPVFFLKSTHFFSQNNIPIMVFVTGYIIQDFFRKTLLALNKIKIVLLIDSLFVLVFVVLIFLGTITLKNILYTIAIVNVLSAMPGLFYFIKNMKIPQSWKYYIDYHLTQGKWLLSASIVQWSSSNFFVLISGAYLGIEALGALRLVQSFFGVLNIILQTVENYFLPKVAKIYYQNKILAKQFIKKMALRGAVIFGAILLIFFIFSDQIIILAGGEKYQQYGYLIKIVAILYIFIFSSYPVRIAVRILELNKTFFIGYLISFFVSLISFHFLLKYTHLYGAVLGLIINQIVMLIYWKNQLKKHQFA